MLEPHSAGSAGVVLVNLGTPDEPTLPAVRRYLREFLSDRRVVDLPPLWWKPILELHILHGHARRSSAKYASVWYDRGSPLLVHMMDLAEGLRTALADTGVAVEAAMRYGRPALGQVLDDLRQRGLDRVLVVPMYPQFATSTTATVIDALSQCLARSQNLPEVRWVRSWPRDPGYIEAMAARIEQTWSEQGRPDFAAGDKLLLSYHGIPVSMVAAGDPYPEECEATTAALRQRLDLTAEQCPMTFQSKFSHSPWLTPATIDTVAELAGAGVRRLDVFCPGFTVDCLETLEEIGLLNREEFLSHGGQTFVRVPCLNDSPAQLTALAGLIRRHLAGWLD
ncbi:MAG: ferrochelatase [Propionibacteriaceae bacterium]|nr:ferrochelatase [Propionibacteriaceae bacterium]